MTQSLKVEWSDDLKTGDFMIDNQHQYLVELINEIADAIEQNAVQQKLGSILPLLGYFTEWHFEREENCMHQRRCPLAAVNKHAHGIFLQTFADFQQEYHAQGASDELARRMYTTLMDWLVNHIKKIDTSIGHCPEAVEA